MGVVYFFHIYKGPTLHLFGNLMVDPKAEWYTIFHVYKGPTLHLFGN